MNYDWWRRALAGEKIGGETLPIHDGDAQPGFYRRRLSSGGAYTGVAIFELEGNLIALKGNAQADPQIEWTHCCHHPVTEEAYRQWEKTGQWPDEDTAMKESLAHNLDNQGPTDPKDILREQIDAALKGVADYDRIDTDQAAAKAQGLRSRLLELSNGAEKEREKRVRPFLDGQKTVNADFMPLVKDAKGGADTLRQAISAHETRVLKARQEAEAKAAAEERERLRIAAEEAKKAEKEGKPPPPAPEPTPAPPTPEPAATQVRGAYGRAASKKLVKKARVVDYGKAVMALSSHPEMKEVVTKLAQRAIDAGVTVDGVEFDEIVDVR